MTGLKPARISYRGVKNRFSLYSGNAETVRMPLITKTEPQGMPSGARLVDAASGSRFPRNQGSLRAGYFRGRCRFDSHRIANPRDLLGRLRAPASYFPIFADELTRIVQNEKPNRHRIDDVCGLVTWRERPEFIRPHARKIRCIPNRHPAVFDPDMDAPGAQGYSA